MYESLITPTNPEPNTGSAGAKPSTIDLALANEGVSGRAADFVRSIYQQESGSGKNTKTSNAGAVGGMQIIPGTFKSVADDGWDINNPEHNLRAGIRYAKQGFDAAGGDPVLAGAYYYGGPGGMAKARQGVAVSDPRNPKAPNTLQYGQQVASRMAEPPKDEQYYTPQRGQYASLITPPPERGFGGAVADAGLALGQGAVGAFKSISDLAGANNPVSETLEGASNFLQSQKSEQSKAILANSQERVREAEATGDWKEEVGAYMQMLWDQPAEMVAQGLGSFATMGAGKILQASKLANAAKASGMSKEAFFRTKEGAEAIKAAADLGFKANIGMGAGQGVGAVKGSQYEQTFNAAKARGMSDEEADALASEAQAYGGAGTGQQILGGVLGAGAAATGPIERLIAGKSAAAGMRSIPGGAVRGLTVEGTPEFAQGAQERLAGNDAAISSGVMDESQRYQGVVGQGVMEGTIGGLIGGGAGAIESALAPAQVVPTELKPVVDKAAEPNSPLSRAATANMDAAAQAVTPAAPEETSKVIDPISTRVAEIEAEVRANGVLDTLRTIGQRGLTEKEFLEALAIARNPEMDAKSPLIRQRALESLEEAMGWAREGKMPMDPATGTPYSTDLVAQPAPVEPGTDLTTQGERGLGDPATPAFDPNIVDVDATRVDNMIDGQRAIDGPRPGIGMDGAGVASAEPVADTGAAAQPQASPEQAQESPQPGATEAAADQAPEQAQGEAQEVVSQDGAEFASPAPQQTVDEATKGLPRVDIPPVAAGELPNASNTAQRRKRGAQIAQLVGNGFETVERQDKSFVLSNSKTGQRITLEGMADAQMARAAISKLVTDRANTAAASPTNDRLEPTAAQIEAGNYKKSDVIDLNGTKIVIENPAGSMRRGVSPEGKAWETKMAHHYGEFLGTEGADGDRLDVFIGPRPDTNKVYVVDQVNADGSFDEHKVVMGAASEEQARQVYLSNYEQGWTGLGAITEMPLAEFKSWARSERAKQPLMLGKQDKLFTVSDGGTPIQLMALDPSEVGDASAPRTGNGRLISKKDADLIKAIGSIFGVNTQFFRPISTNPGDGFFNGGNTLFINERTTISPLAVFGHEFMHLIKQQNPKAYAAMSKVVRALVKDPKGYRADYFGKDSEQAKSDAPLNEMELEELMSDLNGNFMTDGKFWGQVFAQIQKDYGKEAKGIIAQMSAMLTKAIDILVNSLKGKNFNAGEYVNNMKAVRAAFKEGLVQYAKDAGIGQPAIQAEILRQQQQAKNVSLERKPQQPAKPVEPNPEADIKQSTPREQSEYDAVVAKYKGTDQWLKAPNGKPSALNQRQWVQVRTPSFQAWFGPWEKYAVEGKTVWYDETGEVSKVVDENGEPMVVYHGSAKGGFMEFDRPSGQKRGDLGIFTSSDEGMAASYVRRNRARRVEEPKSTDEQIGWRYVDQDSGRTVFNMPMGDTPEGIAIREKTNNAKAVPMYGSGPEPGSQPGIYALFVNIRNPNESNFEGANWDGTREGQWIVEVDGDQQYSSDGKGYFESREEAQEFANTLNPPEASDEDEDWGDLGTPSTNDYVRPAPEHYESTDSVVKEARRYNNDGAIIRQVRDDGGGTGYSGDPSDVFVAFEPNQLKSADFNSGAFSGSGDIRKSTAKLQKRPQDPAIGDKTDVSKLPNGREVPPSAAIGGLESSLELARSKSYRRGRDLKKDIQDRVLNAAKQARVKLSDRTKSTFKFLSGMVVADAKFALQSNENAVGWYDQKVSRAIGALSTVHPEIESDPRSRLAFLWALATTSNGLKVNKNFELAERAYREWRATGVMPTKVGVGNAAQAINKGMAAYNTLVTKVGDERMLKFMGTKFEVGQIQRMLGMKVGGEWMPTPVRGSAILGPKIGNGFFSNLNGYFDALTMDRWLMRTWGRMTGTLLEVTKQDIDKSRRKLADKISGLSDAERRAMGLLIGRPVKKNMTRAELDAVAKAAQKASMKTDKRGLMMAADATNEFRKASNLHHMTMDGQKEAPSGPAERNWIRAVFQESLEALRADGLDMTMSDLQALLWYPERRLYDAAKSDEDVANGYEDDEAPDYANAAYDLAIENGISRTRVLAAMDAAEARGTVQGKQLSDEEKQAMLEEFRSPPEQAMQMLYEVAPDPDNKELTDAWNKLSQKEREQITKLVRDAILSDVASAVGAKVGKTVVALGGFEGQINPNLVTEFSPKKLSYQQARALAAAIGIALDQKSVAVADPRIEGTNGMVRITLPSKAAKLAPAIMRAIGDSTGAYDFTSRGNNIDVLNFTKLSTESFADKIEDAIGEFDDELEFAVAYGEVKSELVSKDEYESEIEALRPGSGREVLERVWRARDRAREIVAAELRGRQPVEVPGSTGSARRADAGGEILRSPGRDGGGRGQGRSSADRSLEGSERAAAQEALTALPGAPQVKGFTGPDPRLVSVAQKYAKDNGITLRRQAEYVKVDPERAARIADAYAAMPHDPQNPRVKEAYQNLVKQTVAQYRALEDAGYKFWFMDMSRDDNQQYASSPWNALRDIRANKQMGVFPTADGFGSNEAFGPQENPLLEDTGIQWPVGNLRGKLAPVLANDLFRAVHDAFGHGLEGAGFRAEGEENAWQAHVRLFAGSAVGAITSETRGQNSWLNYGPNGETNRTAKVEDTVFADQKTGLMPEWTWTEGRVDDVQDDESSATEESTNPEPIYRDDVDPVDARGRKVVQEVEIEETGKTGKLSVDAGKALVDYNQRVDAMKQLLECLKK